MRTCFGRPYGAIALLDSFALVRRQDHCWLTDHARLATEDDGVTPALPLRHAPGG